MKEVRVEINDGMINVWLSGHIDSANAEEVKSELFGKIGDAAGPVTVDASGLEYISSAGLRILLQLRKKHAELHITDVSPEVYEIFDVTGFTQMMDVSRAYKKVSIDGCEVIGKGANGTIYRIDKDNVVKVYNNADALEDIQHEREVATANAECLGHGQHVNADDGVDQSHGSCIEEAAADRLAQESGTEDPCF